MFLLFKNKAIIGIINKKKYTSWIKTPTKDTKIKIKCFLFFKAIKDVINKSSKIKSNLPLLFIRPEKTTGYEKINNVGTCFFIYIQSIIAIKKNFEIILIEIDNLWGLILKFLLTKYTISPRSPLRIKPLV